MYERTGRREGFGWTEEVGGVCVGGRWYTLVPVSPPIPLHTLLPPLIKSSLKELSERTHTRAYFAQLRTHTGGPTGGLDIFQGVRLHSNEVI